MGGLGDQKTLILMMIATNDLGNNFPPYPNKFKANGLFL